MIKEKIQKILGLLRGCIYRMIYMKRLKTGGRFILGRHSTIEVGKFATISVGDNVLVRRFLSIYAASGNIVVGNNVFLNESVILAARKGISIGDRTLIGPGVKIYDHDHIYDRSRVYNEYKTDEVIIGHDCWIGANVVILRGSKIGNNVVIGAGCVVKGEIPNNTLVTQSRELILKPLV